MDYFERLRKKITKESHAYGYTLAVWASGAILLTSFEVPVSGIFLYIFGALFGFFILAFTAFNNLLAEVKHEDNVLIVVSMIHFIAAIGTVYVSYLLTKVLSGSMLYFLVGINVTTVFNILLLVEDVFSEFLLYLESRIVKFFDR